MVTNLVVNLVDTTAVSLVVQKVGWMVIKTAG